MDFQRLPVTGLLVLLVSQPGCHSREPRPAERKLAPAVARGTDVQETRIRERRARLERELRKEALNPLWSKETTRRLTDQFRRNAKTDSVTLGHVECRSTMCRIELSYRDQGVGQMWQDRLLRGEIFRDNCILTSPGVASKDRKGGVGGIRQLIYLVCRDRV